MIQKSFSHQSIQFTIWSLKCQSSKPDDHVSTDNILSCNLSLNAFPTFMKREDCKHNQYNRCSAFPTFPELKYSHWWLQGRKCFLTQLCFRMQMIRWMSLHSNFYNTCPHCYWVFFYYIRIFKWYLSCSVLYIGFKVIKQQRFFFLCIKRWHKININTLIRQYFHLFLLA